ncbi:hypothetical protein, partial [Endozoicomonas arenosclerae]|uniref:hypothetical protein n=1 Tax=Endozoicomonas arenosclerae TaxID=1633495 RepID=UPI0015609D63
MNRTKTPVFSMITNTKPLKIKSEAKQKLINHITSHEKIYKIEEYDPENEKILMQPILIEDAFKPIKDEEVIFNLFSRMSKEADYATSSFYRVYIDGKLSPKDEFNFINSKPITDESLKQYFERVSNKKKFAVVINGAEQWSDDLAKFTKNIFEPVVEEMGYDASTIECTLFIGNYGYTPFGIHVDDPFTQVVHFHLGPSEKEMTLFEPDFFHRINGPTKNCFEPEKIISKGETFNISPGDIFLLPPHYYHIGNTPNFSVGIAIAISKYPKKNIAKHILDYSFNEEIEGSSIEEIISNKKNIESSISKFIEDNHKKYVVMQKSRGGLRYSYKSES